MRVLISGYYGYGNFGDEALLAGLLSLIRELGAEPLVLSGQPERTRAEHGVEAVHRYRGLPGALRRADALISGGGGLLQDASSSRSLSYYLGVLRLARLAGLRTMVYGQSIGPLSSAGLRRVGRVLRPIPVAVRDTISSELLAPLGVQAELTADPALLLEPGDAQPVDVLLIPRSPYRGFSQDLLAAGEEALASGLSVGVMAIQPEEDAPEVGFLLERLGAARPIQAGSYAEALAACAAASLVLSVRLHGLVFAAAAGRPHAGLIYDPKVRGFLERSGGVSFADPVDRLALVSLIHDPPEVDETRLSALRLNARQGGKWLARQLQGTGL